MNIIKEGGFWWVRRTYIGFLIDSPYGPYKSWNLALAKANWELFVRRVM